MGRLIDADKLRTQFKEPADWSDTNQALVHITGIWAEIDAAETVEAISMDWIKKHIASLNRIGYWSDVRAIEAMVIEWKGEQENASRRG